MDDLTCDGYDLEMVPKKASLENKTGMTFKGSDGQYLDAQRMLKSLFHKKGEKLSINGIDISISDVPNNKPIKIEIKPKGGMSGKANLKIWGVNNRGSATIMVSKPSGADPMYSKVLGLDVVKHLIDGIISGSIKEEDFEKFKRKNPMYVVRKQRFR